MSPPAAASAAPAVSSAAVRSPERSRWIDAARGIGITLIVVGHNEGLWLAAPQAGRVIFAFHVPLFFAIVGATSLRPHTWRAAGRRAAALWLSYLAMCLLSLPLAPQRSDYESLPRALLGILYGTGHTIQVSPLWFLPCLALTLLAVHAIDAARGRRPGEVGALWGDGAASLACAALGLVLMRALDPLALERRLAWGTLVHAGAPLNLDLVPLGAAFVFLGRLLRALTERCAAHRALLWSAAAACSAAFAALYLRTAPLLDLNLRVLEPGFPALAGAAFACTALLLLARGLEHTRAGALAAALGTKTLIVLWLHAGLERRAWEALADVMPMTPAIAASILVALLLPYAIDVWLMRRPRVRGVIYAQPWPARSRATPS